MGVYELALLVCSRTCASASSRASQFRDLAEMRSAARRWCREVAGQRIHGATRRQRPSRAGSATAAVAVLVG